MGVNKRKNQIEDLSKSIPACLSNIGVWGAAYKKAILKGLFFKDYVLGEDLVFFCEVMSRARNCLFLGKIEYANRLRQGSATRSAETFRKIYDRITYNESMFKTIAMSGKDFGVAFTHSRGNLWIECIPSLIFNWPDRKERAKLFCRWCESMRLASSLHFFSCWQRLVSWIVSRSCSMLVSRLIAVLPYNLKCRGFHR